MSPITPPRNKAEFTIVVLLRIVGIGGLLAIPAIFLPFGWMNSIHEFLGLGVMPNAPIVSYLARSLTAFYAIAGAIIYFVSLDIRRNRSFVKLWAVIAIALSVVLFGIDLTSGMPLGWTLSEGPPMLAIGLILHWCAQRIEPPPAEG